MSDFTDNLKPLYDGEKTLKDERARSQINVDELAKHLLSRDGFHERQQRVTKILEAEPLFSKKQNLNLSRPVRLCHLPLQLQFIDNYNRIDTMSALLEQKHSES